MASVTETLKKQRVSRSAPVKTGQWHADFSTVKKWSDQNNTPIFGVWSNGDACGHCIAFEQCLLDKTFTNWAKTSGVAMWIGFSSDTSKEDKYEGTGFNWSRKDKLTAYPFVRLYWKKGKVDVCQSGDWWTGGSSKGASKLVSKLQSYLKSYTPVTTSTSTTTTTTTTTSSTPKIYKLSYKKNTDGKTYSLTVNGKVATKLTAAVAKAVCDKYNSCGSCSV